MKDARLENKKAVVTSRGAAGEGMIVFSFSVTLCDALVSAEICSDLGYDLK